MQPHPHLCPWTSVPRQIVQRDLEELERRMGAIRWSIHAASKLANVPAVALSKWKSGALPIGSTYVRHLSALEAVLLEEEARLARYLASLRSRPAGKAHQSKSRRAPAKASPAPV